MRLSPDLPDFTSLRKNLRKPASHLTPVKIALLGDTATQLLAQAITGYGYHAGLRVDLFESQYNQIERQILDPGSELYAYQPDVVVIFHAGQKAAQRFARFPSSRVTFADRYLTEVRRLWESLSAHQRGRVIHFNLAEPEDAVFGNYGNKTDGSLTYQIRKINLGLMDLAREFPNTFILDVSALQNRVGRSSTWAPHIYVTTDTLFSVDFLPLVAKSVIDITLAAAGRIKKCLILDLDGTLWGGVIADDGLENIHVGDLGIGRAFTELQLWVKQLQERGIILAVCSKNTESVAREPFEKHPEMVLRLDDFAVFVANWHNKVDNIRTIQQALNIGYDSMVFVDDSAFERNLVREHLPEVTVPELPDDPAEYLSFLQRLNLFETVTHSAEDTDRTQKYQEEAQRIQASARFTSVDDYLASLNMVAAVEPFSEFNRPRIVQLINRSNQFNLRTVRYTDDQVARIVASDRHHTLSFTLSDRFGDYGLISLLILEGRPEGLFIDTWIMSCRVLKRGMEELIVNTLVALGRELGYRCLIGEYLPTAKNGLVERLYADLGFTFDDDTRHWVLGLDDCSPRPCFIQETWTHREYSKESKPSSETCWTVATSS